MIRIIIMIITALGLAAVAVHVFQGDRGLFVCSCPDECLLHPEKSDHAL